MAPQEPPRRPASDPDGAPARSAATSIERVPPQARWLGGTGAIPFYAFALAIWFAPPAFREWARNAMVAYGMVILAFVGALHWGFAMKTPGFDERDRWTWMGWSVTPALAAWTASLFPFRPAIAILAATFVVHLALDHLLASRSGLPPWYLKMRRALTAAVVAALVVAFAAPL
ncbi:MAG: DUF3429 domain-containing protein [Burkholderiales bacterium]